jgi:hypothetical protein
MSKLQPGDGEPIVEATIVFELPPSAQGTHLMDVSSRRVSPSHVSVDAVRTPNSSEPGSKRAANVGNRLRSTKRIPVAPVRRRQPAVPVGRDIRRAGHLLVVARDLDQVAAGVVEHSCRDRAHRDGLLGESHSESAKSLELQVDVVDGERGEGDAVLD